MLWSILHFHKKNWERVTYTQCIRNYIFFPIATIPYTWQYQSETQKCQWNIFRFLSCFTGNFWIVLNWVAFWGIYCETQPPASIGWVALSSVVRLSSRIGNISSHLHYMMFPSIQTIYFLWGYDPGTMTVSTYLLLLSWAQFTVV